MPTINKVNEGWEQKINVATLWSTEKIEKQKKINEKNLAVTLAERWTEEIGEINKYA